MEEHRLKPMKEGYDEKFFNELYQSTGLLRKKLAYEIDPRRYGVETKDIISWFDVKFIFAFNKYFGEMPNNQVKARVLSALQTYKFKLLRYSYNKKTQIHNSIDLENVYNLSNILIDYEDNEQETLIKLASAFMKEHLSQEAYLVFQTELNPPPFIVDQMVRLGRKNMKIIPTEVIASFFEISIQKDRELRREIENTVEEAREYFTQHQLC
jgi:hypothetical protein